MSAFLRSLKLTNFLSFGPQSPEIELTPLNVLIGPNACGKSNFIEALELLHATPTDLADAIRIGGAAGEWLWKGPRGPGTPGTSDWPEGSSGAEIWGAGLKPAVIEARICRTERALELRYRLAFREANSRLEIVDEALENSQRTKPDALAITAELLVEAKSQTQVIVTTHSDVLVSALTEEADSVLVSDLVGGSTEFRRLDSGKLEKWLEQYRLGEIWRMGKLGGNL